jgi:hypothetical protein
MPSTAATLGTFSGSRAREWSYEHVEERRRKLVQAVAVAVAQHDFSEPLLPKPGDAHASRVLRDLRSRSGDVHSRCPCGVICNDVSVFLVVTKS